MFFTLFGMTISLRPESLKASLPIISRPSGKIIFVKYLHSLNASYAISLRLLGNITYSTSKFIKHYTDNFEIPSGTTYTVLSLNSKSFDLTFYFVSASFRNSSGLHTNVRFGNTSVPIFIRLSGSITCSILVFSKQLSPISSNACERVISQS